MRKCLHLILAFLLMISAVADLFDYANYQLNKSFIADTFCVNKSDKEMKCEGKCFLMSKIKENKSTDEQQPLTFVDVDTKWQVFFECVAFFGFDDSFTLSKNFDFNPLLIKTISQEIFHPPQ